MVSSLSRYSSKVIELSFFILSYFLRFIGILGDCIYVYGDFLPRTVFRRFTAFCAIIRMLFLTCCFLVFHHFFPSWSRPSKQSPSYHHQPYDLIILDGVSTPIPWLRLCSFKVLFYCHFPDLVSLLYNNNHNHNNYYYYYHAILYYINYNIVIMYESASIIIHYMVSNDY
jgi:hypothetical protein